MAFAGNKAKTRPDIMMVEFGTRAHMTGQADKVIYQEPCSMSIYLADDSIVSATQMGV